MPNRVPTPKDRLTPADLAFLIDVLGRDGNDDALQALLGDEEAFLQILDLPAVFQALINSPAIVDVSPRFYFYVMARHVFRRAGLDDVPVTEYVSTVLTDRLSSARRRTHDTPPNYVVDFLERIQSSHGGARFDWWVAAGDHFLVLTGLYPEFIRRRTEDHGAPSLDFYEKFGSQAYRAASDHPRARESDLTGTLHRLSEAFGETRRALNQIAEDYLFLSN
ncbi:MAG: hypothetical protein ACR2OZ_02960 [Verrucomicrobiales bacterium]